MVKIGFHASHELFSPSQLIHLAERAYAAGFYEFSCSDHFSPWSEVGQSGYAWSWLGAAMAKIPCSFGTVCAPGQRYHPAIIAQASATLAEMFPDRFWVALGTGQNVNEHITGDPWPTKAIRQQRLHESVAMIRALWAGETVSMDGLVRSHKAKLYTRPTQPPLIFGAAITEETAEWVASWADGLLTVAKPLSELQKTIAAFHRGGGTGKPVRIQAAIALERSDRVAEAAAYNNWGIATLEANQLQDIELPEHFDALVEKHKPNEVADILRVSSDIQQHIDWLKADFSTGVETVYLHYVGKNIESFIESYAKFVLPTFQ